MPAHLGGLRGIQQGRSLAVAAVALFRSPAPPWRYGAHAGPGEVRPESSAASCSHRADPPVGAAAVSIQLLPALLAPMAPACLSTRSNAVGVQVHRSEPRPRNGRGVALAQIPRRTKDPDEPARATPRPGRRFSRVQPRSLEDPFQNPSGQVMHLAITALPDHCNDPSHVPRWYTLALAYAHCCIG